MKMFLIRERDDNSGKIVGSALVTDVTDLWHTMDEFDNPHDYEYLRVRGTVSTLLRSGDLTVNEALWDQVPPADDELADDAEAGDEARKCSPWKTMVQLCGGQGKFDAMYGDIYGVQK